MSGYLFNLPYQKRTLPLIASQFLNVYIESAFKMLVLMTVVGFHFDFVKEALFVLVVMAAYVLPFVIFSGPVGLFCDFMPKRGVLVLSSFIKFCVLIFSITALIKYPVWGPWPVFTAMFLLTTLSAFFSPAFYGILPETFMEKELSKVNGDVGVASFAATIIGIAGAPILAEFCEELASAAGKISWMPQWLQNPNGMCGFWLCLLSLFSFFVTVQIYPTIAGHHQGDSVSRNGAKLFRGIRVLASDKALFLAAFGEAFFISIGVALQSLLFLFCKYSLSNDGGDLFEIILMQMFPMIGMGLGCLAVGRCSRDKIELGFVPFGALGLAVFLPLTAHCPGNALTIGSYLMHPLCLIWLVLAGFCGGFFLIPLRAFLQKDLAQKTRGSALAAANAMCFLMVFLVSLLMLLLLLGGAAVPLPDCFPLWFCQLLDRVPSFPVVHLISWLGIASLIVVIASGLLFPMLLIRAAVIFLTHTFYRVRIIGAENIPQNGPALLVANHTSYIDSFLILACTSRRVRFLMREDFYRNKLIHFYAVRAGAIEVPCTGAHRLEDMFEEIKQALRSGCVVCVFPEGEVSRNGVMGSFKSGYAKMFPDDVHVPLIPINIGLVWGSMFSYYYGKIRLRFSSQIPYPATVSVGAPLRKSAVDTAFRLRQAVAELAADAEAVPRDVERTLHYQLAKNAKRRPFRKIFYDQNGNSLNMFKVLIAGIIFSREIRRMMPEETKYVGMLLPNVLPAPLVLVGIQMADKVPAPLNFTASRDALRKSIENAGITHILTSRKFIAKIKMEPMPEFVYLEDLAAKIPKLRKLIWTLAAIFLPHNQLMNIVSPATHRDVFATAVLLFSSGSTGIPKGVMLSHHNINGDFNSLLRVVGWTEEERVLGSLPLFHSFGFTTAFWLPLMCSCRVIYVPSPLDCAAIGKAMQDFKVSIMLATPTFIQSYIKRCKPEQFSSLRLAVVGAEKMRRDIADKFFEITNHNIVLMEGYGCTELSPIVTINISRSFQDLGKMEGKEGSIGTAMPGICVKVVDPVTREELPPDTDGLMLVKGPNVMQGYLNQPEQTANVIRNGWYETGDIVRMDCDGYVTISGRLSRFSKIGGEMVPHELLECVMNELTGTEDRIFAVGGIPDSAKGEALAVLYIASATTITPDEMNAKLRERNIPNLWIPRTANYRAVEKLPILGNGKLDLMNLASTIKEVFHVG